MGRRFFVYVPFLILACLLNFYYHWDAIWTLWAKQYIKDQDIVISLTTTPHRINQMETPLECLALQNIPIRKIFVNIPYMFKRDNLEYAIPEWLEAMPNVTILRTADYGPATKLLGTLKNASLNEKTIIITVDDDTCYPPNMVLRLAVRAKQYPKHAVGISGVELNFKQNKQEGIVRIKQDHAAATILEGFAGVAYRKSFFNDEVFEIDAAPSSCYTSDDLYLSYHLAKNNIPRQTIFNRHISFRNVKQESSGNQSDALHKMQVSQAARYYDCLIYLRNKYPEVLFAENVAR